MNHVFLNCIATAVPPYDIHHKYIDYVTQKLTGRDQLLFQRMARKVQIDRRYSFLETTSAVTNLDGMGFYDAQCGPDTRKRMQFYRDHALSLAQMALDKLELVNLKDSITNLIITSCTGFYAPGLDADIIHHYKLDSSIERTMVGFMGCNAALHALKLAAHIVRSAPESKVLIVNLELCTLHFQNTLVLEKLLSFLPFADGCAASLVSSKNIGLEIKDFYAEIIPATENYITWDIGSDGFEMTLSGLIPAAITEHLPAYINHFQHKNLPVQIDYWAIHPGGHSVLNAAEQALDLPISSLHVSRSVLQNFGNMSSATIMFILQDIIQNASSSGSGCALAFGPGMSIEGMSFHVPSALS